MHLSGPERNLYSCSTSVSNDAYFLPSTAACSNAVGKESTAAAHDVNTKVRDTRAEKTADDGTRDFSPMLVLYWVVT